LKNDYGVTDALFDKYRYDLSSKANAVSEEYENVKEVLQNIKTYEHCVNDYYNNDYTGDTYFRGFPQTFWQDRLAEANANAYGLNYVWEKYRTSVLTKFEEGTDEYVEADNNLKYSTEYANYINAVKNLERYQGYADGTLDVPTFRDMAGGYCYR